MMRIILFVLLLVSVAQAQPYVWLCNDALPLPLDSTAYPFATGDTIGGSVHCNGVLAIAGHPVFYDSVTTSADSILRGPDYGPYFPGSPRILTNAPPIEIPADLNSIRDCASADGAFFAWSGVSYRCVLDGSMAHVYLWPTGTPFDSTNHWQRPINGRLCMFFDAPLELKSSNQGFTGQLTIGSSHTIRLLDHIYYSDADHNTGITPYSSLSILGIASEADIKIANTPANGRNNSHGRGWAQTNPDSTSIVVTAALWALGKVTFEEQNDPDSGYVCECIPDDRGTFYLFGSMVQNHAGNFRRSTNGFTGYMQQLRFDRRLQRVAPPAWPWQGSDSAYATDTLDFGIVPPGVTAADTVGVHLPWPELSGPPWAPYPFAAARLANPYWWWFDSLRFRVSFTPPRPGLFTSAAVIRTENHVFRVILRGRCLNGLPRELDISPNPFNLTTTIRYTIPEAGRVRIVLYDLLGRVAREFTFDRLPAGEHNQRLDASDLASGVYFVQLETGGSTLTKKVLLLK